MKTLYEELGIDPDATAGEIKMAFRRRSMAAHPDRNQGREAEAAEEQARINKAHDVLGDPARRAEYDATGATRLKTPLEAEAIQALMQLAHQALDEPDPLLLVMRRLIAKRTDEVQTMRAQRLNQREILVRRRGSISVKEGENLLQKAIDQKVLAIDDMVSKMDHGLNYVLPLVLKMLDNFTGLDELQAATVWRPTTSDFVFTFSR